jgi:ElaB/YqjD/DUF883 family membrane-anchored ribosome-binding protein
VPAWRRRLEAAEHALAEAQAVRKQAETALNGANDRLNEAPKGVLAAARRSLRYAPSRLLATTSGRAL